MGVSYVLSQPREFSADAVREQAFCWTVAICPWASNVAVQTAEKDGAWTDTVLCG